MEVDVTVIEEDNVHTRLLIYFGKCKHTAKVTSEIMHVLQKLKTFRIYIQYGER